MIISQNSMIIKIHIQIFLFVMII